MKQAAIYVRVSTADQHVESRMTCLDLRHHALHVSLHREVGNKQLQIAIARGGGDFRLRRLTFVAPTAHHEHGVALARETLDRRAADAPIGSGDQTYLPLHSASMVPTNWLRGTI